MKLVGVSEGLETPRTIAPDRRARRCGKIGASYPPFPQTAPGGPSSRGRLMSLPRDAAGAGGAQHPRRPYA